MRRHFCLFRGVDLVGEFERSGMKWLVHAAKGPKPWHGTSSRQWVPLGAYVIKIITTVFKGTS